MPLVQTLLITLKTSSQLLFYALTTLLAGAIGHTIFHLLQNLLTFALGSRVLRPYRELVDFVCVLCVLVCSTAFLIVAVGPLFLNLAGVLSEEYEGLLAQVGTAVLGVTIFAGMCFCVGVVGVGGL